MQSHTDMISQQVEPADEILQNHEIKQSKSTNPELSFSEVIKMTNSIRYCDSRSSVAIENLISDVRKFKKIANFKSNYSQTWQ